MAFDPEIRTASLDEILELRIAVLIAGTDRVSPYFDGDRDDTTLHFGAFDAAGQTVACASCMIAEDDEQPAWQLRGMAVGEGLRSCGIGARLLAHIETALSQLAIADRIWCNARAAAVPFYERNGWHKVGDVFDIAGVGPHYKMIKR